MCASAPPAPTYAILFLALSPTTGTSGSVDGESVVMVSGLCLGVEQDRTQLGEAFVHLGSELGACVGLLVGRRTANKQQRVRTADGRLRREE